MQKLKNWRITIDMVNMESDITDRIIVIMQKATPGQCRMMVIALFENWPYQARIVGSPIEMQGPEQAVLFTM